MSENLKIGIIVRDCDIRDLVSLNLRFESFITRTYNNLKSFLSEPNDIELLILDVCGERDPKSLILSARQYKPSLPVLLLTDRGTPKVENEPELIIETIGDRKRFDAIELINLIKQILETRQNEPLRHPLTGLPSGAAVERHINNLIASGVDFALIVSDLDNMKAFNQRFGYSHGDELLCSTVKLISDILKDHPHNLNFIGHRGEDDFVLVTSCETAQAIGEKIVDRFDEMVSKFFSKTDIERGYFIIKDRRGNELKFPLTTISLVIIFTDGRQFLHPAELFDAADEIMTEVKMRGVNQSYCAVEKPQKKTEKKDILLLDFDDLEL